MSNNKSKIDIMDRVRILSGWVLIDLHCNGGFALKWKYVVVLIVFVGCKSSVPTNSMPAPVSSSTPTLTNANIVVTGTQVITTSLGKPGIRLTVKKWVNLRPITCS